MTGHHENTSAPNREFALRIKMRIGLPQPDPGVIDRAKPPGGKRSSWR